MDISKWGSIEKELRDLAPKCEVCGSILRFPVEVHMDMCEQCIQDRDEWLDQKIEEEKNPDQK